MIMEVSTTLSLVSFYMNTEKKGELKITIEVAIYDDPDNICQLKSNENQFIDLNECITYEDMTCYREKDVEMEESSAHTVENNIYIN